MNKVLSVLTIAVGLTMFTGCSEITTAEQKVVMEVKTDAVSEEYITEVTDWCYGILKQKQNILIAVQTEPDKVKAVVDSMKEASAHADVLKRTGDHPQLIEVLNLIGAAGYELDLYMSTQSAKNFMKATKCLNNAVVIVNK